MRKQRFEKWVADTAAGLRDLHRDLKEGAPFDTGVVEDDFLEATGYSMSGKSELSIRKALAKWLYHSDDENLFRECMGGYFKYYGHFLFPAFEAVVTTGDRQVEEGVLYLARTRNYIATIYLPDWPLAEGDDYELDFYKPENLDLGKTFKSFMGRVEDYATVEGEYPLEVENIEEYEEQGRIGGSVAYASNLDWIKVPAKQYIITY